MTDFTAEATKAGYVQMGQYWIRNVKIPADVRASDMARTAMIRIEPGVEVAVMITLDGDIHDLPLSTSSIDVLTDAAITYPQSFAATQVRRWVEAGCPDLD